MVCRFFNSLWVFLQTFVMAFPNSCHFHFDLIKDLFLLPLQSLNFSKEAFIDQLCTSNISLKNRIHLVHIHTHIHAYIHTHIQKHTTAYVRHNCIVKNRISYYFHSNFNQMKMQLQQKEFEQSTLTNHINNILQTISKWEKLRNQNKYIPKFQLFQKISTHYIEMTLHILKSRK